MNLRDMEVLYNLLNWPSNPLTPEGKRRMFESMDVLSRVIRHEWFEQLLKRRSVKVLDVCSGGGVGGFALAKILMDRGVDVELVLIDLRLEDLRNALKFGNMFVPHLRLDVVFMRAEDLYTMRRKFDVAMIWGFSMPHFNPWSALRLFASLSSALVKDGLLLVEEVDRMLTIFLGVGYRYIHPEGLDAQALVSIHRGYDIVRGVVRRLLIDLSTGMKVLYEAHLNWSIALIATFMWVFFENVDAGMIDKGVGKAVVLGYGPRAFIEIKKFLEKRPRLLERGELIV